MQQKNYQQEILALIHSGLPQAELAEKLSDYHENDLADALAALTPDERQKLYAVLGVDTVEMCIRDRAGALLLWSPSSARPSLILSAAEL